MAENLVVEKVTFDTSDWDGSASQWDTPEAYCRDCLIDENTGDEKTKDKCHLPYRKPGSSAINKNALRTMATGRGLAAVNASKEAKRKAANWIISKWQAAFGRPAPESIYEIAGKSAPGNKAAFYKGRDGEIWFLGVYSNNFEDVEGEMFSWAAHQEYAKWLKTTGVKPPIIAMHQPQFDRLLHAIHYMALDMGKFTPQQYTDNLLGMYKGTALAQTEMVIPLNGFMLVVGKVFEHKRAVVEKLMQQSTRWGMSHGFIPLEKDGNIFTKYRSFEFTVGPLVLAANKVTAISFAFKDSEDFITMAEKIGLSAEERQLITDLLDGTDIEAASEQARTILQQALASAKLLEEEAADEKQAPVEPEEEEDEEEAEDEVEEKQVGEYEVMRAKLFADLRVEELQQSLQKMSETIQAQAVVIEELRTQVAQIQQTEDEKIAGMFTAPDWTLGFGKTKPAAEKTVEELKQTIPAGVVPPTDDKMTPLAQGFWGMFR